MPVRIYDIAKRFGIESKAVLAKAKDLGITAARVPSSSLDKITAEYLESHLGAPKAAAPPPPPVAPEPIVVVKAPEPPPAPIFEPVEAKAPAPVVDVPAPVSTPTPAPVVLAPDIEPPVAPAPVAAHIKVETPASQPVTAHHAPASPGQSDPAPAAELQPPPAPKVEAPPVPPVSRIGEKVGFIHLPAKPAPRTAEKPGNIQPPQRPGQPQQGRGGFGGGRQDFQRGGRQGNFRPGFGQQGGRPGYGQQQRPVVQPPRPVADPKFTAPAGAETITLKPPIIVRDLAEKLNRRPFQIIADLIELKVMATVNQAIDETVAGQICGKYGFNFEVEKRKREQAMVHASDKVVELDIVDKPEDLKPRAPVVTIMGHVDHGKTTLLDVIRKSDVATGEAGGITQHIGAYTISFPHPEDKARVQQITFLDTPGHAAFSAMRARGANVTDIVVLVVAANDGVMPQTLEALAHAQAAKVPIIVAVNKCDHPNANPMKVRQQLQDKGLVPDDWGGDTIFVDVSALTKMNIQKLLEMVIFQADLLELKANPTRPARGNVIESGLAPGGPTATVLVRKGTLRLGDTVICGQFWGRVRALINEEGARLKEAGPSVAVKLLGLNGVPEAGLPFSVLKDEKEAREIGESRAMEYRQESNENRNKVTLENLFATLATSSAKQLKMIVKADTQGSVEAIVEALKKIETDKVSLEIIHSAVGTITESDVMLASASNGIILGFHTRIDNGVSEVAKREGVQVKLYSIIYELVDQVKEAMAGLLDPIIKETTIGAAEVRKLFDLSKGGHVAGCVISHGRVVKGKVRIVRRKGLIYEGNVSSLRRFQDEVNEARAGMECGIRVDGFDDFQIGDVIESFTVEKVAAKL
ncbi:MAG: infB [Verrucomicrobiales bacterium]|nr:infB [Verrucomicrobiales bacterium]